MKMVHSDVSPLGHTSSGLSYTNHSKHSHRKSPFGKDTKFFSPRRMIASASKLSVVPAMLSSFRLCSFMMSGTIASVVLRLWSISSLVRVSLEKLDECSTDVRRYLLARKGEGPDDIVGAEGRQN